MDKTLSGAGRAISGRPMSGPATPNEARRPKRLPLGLALLLPALLVGGVVRSLGAERERPLSEAATAMEARLHAAPEVSVVLLGNSKARTDIDTAALARTLGVKPGSVVTLDVPASTAPAWYAVLENRVYAQGYRPPLVVVYGPLTMTLDTKVYSAIQRQRLEEHMAAVEPVLGPKVLGRSGGATLLDRASERRSEVHTAILDAVKGAAVAWFAPSTGGSPSSSASTSGEDLVARGLAQADPALERLFGESASLASAGPTRVIPVAEAQGPLIASQGGTAADSLLGDFADLVAANGGRLVFVRAPLAPTDRASDRVAPEALKGVVSLLNERHAGWMDLGSLDLPDTAFRDELHMNEKGRTVLTARLGEGLVALGATRPGDLDPARAPFVASAIERVGAAPALPPITPTRDTSACGFVAATPALTPLGDGPLGDLGAGAVSPVVVTQDGQPLRPHAPRADFAERCGGAFAHFGRELRLSPSDSAEADHAYALALSPDLPLRTDAGETAWWVYPGTTLRFTFTEPWPGAAPPAVHAIVRAVTPGTPTLRAGGASVDLAGEAVTRVGAVTAGSTAGTWTIEVSAPAEGPYTLVEALAVGDGEDRAWLVGGAPTPVRMIAARPLYAAPPPVLPAGPVTQGEGDLRMLRVPGYSAVDDPSTFARLGVRDCSPLRVSADGKPLTASHIPVADVNAKGGGRYAHVGDALLFGAPNPLAPATATYTAELDTQRLCEAGWWVYPGDVVTIPGPLEGLRKLRFGATRLQLDGAAFAPSPSGGSGPITVRLRVRDVVRVDATLSADQWNAGPIVLPLDPPLAPRAAPVTLEIASDAASAWVIVSNVVLAEDVGFGDPP